MDQPVTEDWGYEPAKGGMAIEAKLGMFIVMILVSAFGFLVYRRVDMQRTAQQLADNNPSAQISSDADDPADIGQPVVSAEDIDFSEAFAADDSPSDIDEPTIDEPTLTFSDEAVNEDPFPITTAETSPMGEDTLSFDDVDLPSAAAENDPVASDFTADEDFSQPSVATVASNDDLFPEDSRTASTDSESPFADSAATQEPVLFDDETSIAANPFEEPPQIDIAGSDPTVLPESDPFDSGPEETKDDDGWSTAATTVEPLAEEPSAEPEPFDFAPVPEQQEENELVLVTSGAAPLSVTPTETEETLATAKDDDVTISNFEEEFVPAPEETAVAENDIFIAGPEAQPATPDDFSLDDAANSAPSSAPPTIDIPPMIEAAPFGVDVAANDDTENQSRPFGILKPHIPTADTATVREDARFDARTFAYENRVVPASAESETSDVLEVRPDESYWSISKRAYGTSRYFSALALFNSHRIPDPKRLRPGMKVLVPDPELLEKKYPKLFRTQTAKRAPSGFFVRPDGTAAYRIGSDDTLSQIAQKHLGRSSRWIQIYRLNRDVLPNPNRLKTGTVILLPDDATDVQMAP